MFLSIIIPVYKVEPYLKECLDSLAASPLDCWEAILIDDGSPDGCPQICDEYAARDKRFRVIHQENVGVDEYAANDKRFRVIHQQNAGVSAARNAGIDIAKGEWIWFVDSDDVVDMRPVSDNVKWLEKHKDVDLVMFDLETFDDKEGGLPFTVDGLHGGKNEKVNVPVDVSVNKNDFLMKHICYHHPRLWYKRKLINHYQQPIRFSQGIRVAEDLEFQYKYLTLCQHPVKMDAVLYYYRLRETSVTGDAVYRQRAVEDLPIVLKNLALWTKENDAKPEPWYDYRIMKLLQNLLYSASLVQNLNTKDYQMTIRDVVAVYKRQSFLFVHNKKIRLATWSVKAYFLFNRSYLKIKGFQ